MKQRTLLNVSSSINLVFVLNKLCCFLPDEFTERMRCIAIGITPPPHHAGTIRTKPASIPHLFCWKTMFYHTLIFTFLNPSRLANWTGEKDATDNFCVNNTSHIWQFLLLLKVNTVLDESILSLRAAQEWANDILQKLKSGKFVKVCIWN